MELHYIWHDYRYWSKCLFGTICTPANDLEVKVRDLEIFVKALRQSFVRSFNFFILAWNYFIFGMIIDIGPKFYSALSLPYDLEVKKFSFQIMIHLV